MILFGSGKRCLRRLGLLGTLIALATAAATADPNAGSQFTLSPYCPPAMRLDDSGVCRLHNPYTHYNSLYGKGVGGLKTGLPPWRDGFTPAQIDLGRLLFFDPLLSADQTVACSSCHDPALGFSDGRGRSVGVSGEPLARSAPSLWNVTFLQRLKWDGGAKTLEEQMLGPLYSANEMGNSPEQLLARINGSQPYRQLFRQAFGVKAVTLHQIYTALVAFETSLVSLNSRYDWYAHGRHDALNEQEIAGLNVFRSFVARCAECHTPPTFTNQQIAVLGVPETAGVPLDAGAQAITGDASQRAGFRVPSLRNVTLTAPYMHAGNFATLKETVAFYTGGRGHAVPEGEDLKLHWHIWEPNLTDQELDNIVAFLGTLTDQSFVPNVPEQVPSGLPVGRAVNLDLADNIGTYASPVTGVHSATKATRAMAATVADTQASRPIKAQTMAGVMLNNQLPSPSQRATTLSIVLPKQSQE